MIKPEGPNAPQLEIRQLRVIPEIILGPVDLFFFSRRKGVPNSSWSANKNKQNRKMTAQKEKLGSLWHNRKTKKKD